MLGFKRDSHSEVGYLAFKDDAERRNPADSLYKIVADASDAKVFPCKNYSNIRGFAAPEKWLDFFSREPDLKEWKFHLVKRRMRSSTKKTRSRTTKKKDGETVCG